MCRWKLHSYSTLHYPYPAPKDQAYLFHQGRKTRNTSSSEKLDILCEKKMLLKTWEIKEF